MGKITTASQRNISVDLMDVADRWVRTVWMREKAAATGQTARWATFEFGDIFEIAIANIPAYGKICQHKGLSSFILSRL